jgi:hypothetical protein
VTCPRFVFFLYSGYYTSADLKTDSPVPSSNSVDQLAEEKLSAARTIAAYNAQGLESKNFETRVEKIYQIAKRDIRAHAIIQGFFDRATDHVYASPCLTQIRSYIVN